MTLCIDKIKLNFRGKFFKRNYIKQLGSGLLRSTQPLKVNCFQKGYALIVYYFFDDNRLNQLSDSKSR